MKGNTGFNKTLLQVFSLSKFTVQGTLANEPATDKIVHAVADLTLTVQFFDDSVPDLVVGMAAGSDFGLDSTVELISTSAAALLS